MNTQSTNPAVTEVTAPVEPEALVEQLRAFRQQIPDFGPLTVSRARLLRTAAHADAAFVESAINAVGASEAMSQALGLSADDLRQQLALATRWSAVEDELRALLQGVADANLTRRHQVGLSGL